MRITARRLALGEGLAAAVPEMDVVAETSVAHPAAPIALAVETAERPQLLSLLLGGRLKPTAGEVLVDGSSDTAELRRRVALVDTPGTSEPSPGVALRTVVAEELAFAGTPSSRRATDAVLTQHGLADHARTPLRAVPAAPRIRLLSELALLRDGVEALVITSPERHGGDPRGWFGEVRQIAERGVLTIVVTDEATAALLRAAGAGDGSAPAADAEADPEPEPTAPAPAPAPAPAASTTPEALPASPTADDEAGSTATASATADPAAARPAAQEH
ncbi:hypothetical protein [Schumannella soli]|uniref:ABC transporter ATP-binding protein n=1 Tax=Schumannella soli TaxID=2590779 RepID=A0A506Y6Z8_9MICO|nr:hypothetical protein [Schumannella soli]TPW77633.1 hypothetical protein FJ657_02930 [Schumannella soli]